MSAVVVIIGLAAAGLLPAAAIDRNERPMIVLGLAFLYGTGAVYLVLLAMSLAGVPWSLPVAVLGIVALAAIAWPFVRRGEGARASSPLSWIDGATAILIAIHVYGSVIRRPLHWDFWAIWGLKGRVFFEARAIDWRFLQSDWNAFSHPDYPLLVPFNYAFAALAAGEWDDRWLGLFSVAWGVALLLVVRGATGRELPPAVAAAITFAAAAFAMTPHAGLAESPLIAFGTAGLLMLRRGILFDDNGAIRHGALLLGFAAVSKNEGVALVLAAVVAMVVARAPLRRFAVLWIPAALIASWMLPRFAFGLPTDVATGDFGGRFLSRLSDLPLLLSALMRSVSRPYVWLLFLFAILVARPAVLAREKFVLIAVAVQLMIFVIVYLGTPHDAAWHVASSWERISRQLAAPLLIVLMMALAQTWLQRQDHSHAAP